MGDEDEEMVLIHADGTRMLPLPAATSTSGADARRGGFLVMGTREPLWGDFRHPAFMALVFLSFLTRFVGIAHPRSVVFDEVHFGKVRHRAAPRTHSPRTVLTASPRCLPPLPPCTGQFTNWYLTGEYFFDIHPPLGKLTFALASKLIGYDGHYAFRTISEAYPDDYYASLRMVAAFFSFLCPMMMWGVVRQLGLSVPAAIVAATMVLFDNCIVGEGRFILVDSQLFFYILAALFFHFKAKGEDVFSTRWTVSIFACGLSMCGAFSVKWTALALVGVIGCDTAGSLLADLAERNNTIEWTKEFIVRLFALLIVPAVLYLSIFALHILLLPDAGSGDAFMSWEFRKRLNNGNVPNGEFVTAKGLFMSILELHRVMFNANAGLSATHSWGSTWDQWPTMAGHGILYWTGPNAKIYLLGNPLVWWVSTLAMAVFVVRAVKPIARYLLDIPETATSDGQTIKPAERRRRSRLLFAAGLAFFGVVVNLLPFALVTRVCFVYHYIPTLLMAIIVAAAMFDYFVANANIRVVVAMGYFILTAIVFYHFAPWIYAWELTPAEHASRQWRSTWV